MARTELNPESRTGKPMISPYQENTHLWDLIPLVLMGGSASPVRLDWDAPSRAFFIASNVVVIRPWPEPAKNWDAECFGRSAEPALACEWVGPGRNRVNSGPLRIIESKAMSPAGSLRDLAASLSSPHGCLVGRPAHGI